MSLRSKVRQFIDRVGTTPVAFKNEDNFPTIKVQMAIAQLSERKIRTVTANGTVYAWKELSREQN